MRTVPDTKGWKIGDAVWNCDLCGMAFFHSQMAKGITARQKGFTVCPECFDPIHPEEVKYTIRKEKPMPPVGGR